MAGSEVTRPSTRRTVTAPSRRELFSAAGFTALTGIAAAAFAKPDLAVVPSAGQHPDAKLIALHDRFMVLQEQLDASDRRLLLLDDDAVDAMTQAQSDLMDEMDGHVATTMDGHRARARVIRTWHRLRFSDDDGDVIDGHRIGALFRDLLGEPV